MDGVNETPRRAYPSPGLDEIALRGRVFCDSGTKEDDVSAIWAIDINAVKAEAIQLLSQNGVIGDPKGRDFSFGDPDVFDRVFLQRATHIVAPVQPLRMNERATAQQGLYLCPNSSLWGFEFAMKRVLRSDSERLDTWHREKHIEPQARSELLRELHRMNVNYATLFPGLDGFARSLGTNVTVSDFKYVFGDDFDSRV
jgi:hypothetical protein